ncbi:MAG TPA: Gfo/Idh/MocA family oxidoreductase [Ktedonobacteraceae bacterium]|nr:Gfo/Idh/MocA family oxidoreductase [Ktedonobacteraceae bacterium]
MTCNWGIIGPGFVATRAILPAMQHVSPARTLAIASRNNERAQAVAQQFGIERVYSNYQALLDDRDIDVVYIALPNYLHHPWTLRAAEAGKHVLCEKPLATSAGEGAEMISACQRANVLLMEASMYRFHPRMLFLKQMLESGTLGTLRFLHAAFSFPFNNPNNYRSQQEYGGGALLDVGTYCINAVRWLTDSEPLHMQGFMRRKGAIDIDTQALLTFTGEVMAHIQCSFAAAEHQVIEVVGTTGTVTASQAFTAWTDDSTTLLLQNGSHREQKTFAPVDPYQAMLQHFSDCVLGQATLHYRPTDSLGTLKVMDQLRQEAIEVFTA